MDVDLVSARMIRLDPTELSAYLQHVQIEIYGRLEVLILLERRI